jgi:hypothetical protein
MLPRASLPISGHHTTRLTLAHRLRHASAGPLRLRVAAMAKRGRFDWPTPWGIELHQG